MLKLRRAPVPSFAAEAAGDRRLDSRQRAALEHRGPLLRVLGAPGTGKTTVAVELVVDRVRSRGVSPDACLVLSPSRLSAAALRERVTVGLGGTSTEPLARTPAAFGFGILRQYAALRGEPAPRLLSGPEQDVILRELLAGHAAGEGKPPVWPDRVRDALRTRGFRTELRDLLMRAVERGVEPEALADLGRLHERPDWVAAAQVLAEYDEVTAFSTPGAYDPAWILGAASDLLEDDADALDRARSGLRLIVVDDAQELTPAGQRLLRTVIAPGTDLVLLGDPDTAVQTFRGADPHILGSHWSSFAPDGAGRTITLDTAYRLPAAMVEVSRLVAARIGAAAGAGHRSPSAVRPGGTVQVHLMRSAGQEAALAAATFRRAHLVEGVPWSEMALLMRGQSRMGTMRRVLLASGVPVSVPTAELPVRDEVAVRPLLSMLDLVLRRAIGEMDEGGSDGTEASAVDGFAAPAGSPPYRSAAYTADDHQAVVDILQSPVGGADAVALRRLRRALRQEELAGGGGRSGEELVTAAVLDGSRSGLAGALALMGPEGAAARRVAGALAAGTAAAATVVDPAGVRRWAPGVSAETVLWAIWDATGRGPAWRRTALAGGTSGLRADRDLDAALALFDAAARYVDRLPSQGPTEFLEHIRSQDVAGDTLVARAPSTDAVELLTVQGAAGRQWRRVVVAGVQEGVWPDLRLRGSLLGSERLVDVVTGRGATLRAAQAAVRYDETRLFLVAVTRASEGLIVTAVRSDDEQPSVYLDLVDPDGAEAAGQDDGLRTFTDLEHPLTLPSAVAQLRRELVRTDGVARDRAARRLARLADAGVPGADPQSWWAMTGLSDDRPLRAEDERVSVSPSKIQDFQDCGLRWLLQACGGDGPAVPAAGIGTLVHDIAAELGDVDEASMRAEVVARWGRLGLAPGWLSRRQLAEAQEMVTRLAAYVASATAEGWEGVGRELPMLVELTWPAGTGTLAGRVDRLERNAKGELRVVDLKTGSTKPSRDKVQRHAQLGAYQVAVEHGAFAAMGTVSAGAGLLHIGKAYAKTAPLQVQPPLADDDDPGWAGELLQATAEGMAGGRFVARIGEKCTQCPVRSSCPLQPEGSII